MRILQDTKSEDDLKAKDSGSFLVASRRGRTKLDSLLGSFGLVISLPFCTYLPSQHKIATNTQKPTPPCHSLNLTLCLYLVLNEAFIRRVHPTSGFGLLSDKNGSEVVKIHKEAG